MPVSRNRKIERARKRPRIAPSNPGAAPKSPSNNRRLQYIVIVVTALAAVLAAVYVINRRSSQAEVTTPSGLKIQDLKVGDGPSPKMGQTVRVHYIGRLENGKEFNNSHTMGQGQPVEFKLGEVIPGWNEGLQTMKVGGKRKLWIPANLAYGVRGRPPSIPPNSNLEFEIELLGIK